MSEASDKLQDLLNGLKIERENTIEFWVKQEPDLVFWSPNPDVDFFGGFRVVLSSTVVLTKDTSPAVAKRPKGTVDLQSLPPSGDLLDDRGERIVGTLSYLGDELHARLWLPAEDLRTLATLLSMAEKERPRVRVWMHGVEGLKDWDGKGLLKVARTSIRIR